MQVPFFLILASCVFSQSAYTQTTASNISKLDRNVMGLNVKFTDQVSNFGTRAGYVMVLFSQQAAGYKISMERDDFAEQMRNLADAWKSGKPVTVVIERGVQIRSISTPSTP